MSLRYVDGFAQQLPYALRVQVVGYARSVDEAADDIFAEANREINEELRDQLTIWYTSREYSLFARGR
jgi:hypothetical protein